MLRSVLRIMLPSLFPEAVRDGLGHPDVKKLATLGSSGTQASHCSRDLVRILAPCFKELPDVSYIQVPVVSQKADEVEQLQLEVQFPHEVFSYYSDKPFEFHQLFGSEAEVKAFWDSKDVRDPAFAQHPALLQQNYKERCVPVRVHSDGVVMSKVDTLHVTSWASFFGTGNVLEIQLLYSALVKSACTDGTMEEIFRCLQWSFTACLQGRHPTTNWKGTPWPAGSKKAALGGTLLHPEGYFLGVFQLVGDLEELANQYGLSHWASNEPCFWCSCNTSDRPWSDFAPGAAWRATVHEPQIVNPPPSPHPVWTIPGMSRWAVSWDILHGLDLGPTLHVLGNVLEDLVSLRTLGRSAEQRLKTLWGRAQEIYREEAISSRVPHLQLSSWRVQGDYPKLRCKGNEARHLVPVVLKLVEEYDPSMSEYAMTRKEMLTSLIAFYTTLDTKNFFFTPEQAAAGKMQGLTFLKNYVWLAHYARQAGHLRWQVTVKFHYVAHACELLKWANPKYGSTYQGESYVGRISRIALTASYGKPSYLLGGLLMQKMHASRAVRIRKQLL